MKHLLTYPENYEVKVGFDKVRVLLVAYALSDMGREELEALAPIIPKGEIERRLAAITEMMSIAAEGKEFPSLRLADLRKELVGMQADGTFLVADRLPSLLSLLRAVEALYRFFRPKQAEPAGTEEAPLFPALAAMLAEGLEVVPSLAKAVDNLLDRFGEIKDNASPALAEIRNEKASVERRTSQIVRRVLSRAIKEGWSDSDALPSIRDGHAVIPVNPAYKRAIPGIVHDESATGKTFFIEPLEVVENNNRFRELEAEERREIIRILIALAEQLRPHLSTLLSLYAMVGRYDAVGAIAKFAAQENAIVPRLSATPCLRWLQARHPILRRSLEHQGREIIPLDISLEATSRRLLVISGPNAGGKSVCLKTCALLQYMLQCGIPIPVHPDSEAGIFSTLAINIGDDQSIEDDLSTYSSHLKAMADFCRLASPQTLLMVDEFGAGTEPELGGAIAEALLSDFNKSGAFGLITTHYRNLKQFAATTEGLTNGAMLYDRGAMRPLFALAIGQPGSSFAMQIAKRSGLPASVLGKAREMVGAEVIDSDGYVQDIARDKRYWERKRDEIRRKNRQLEGEVAQYQEKLEALEAERRKILEGARQEAAAIVKASNALVERTVREIKESNAQREQTLAARQRLAQFGEALQEGGKEEEGASSLQERLQWEREKIERRGKRKAEKKRICKTPSTDVKGAIEEKAFPPLPESEKYIPTEGDRVRILPNGVEATVIEVKGNTALLALGDNLSTRKPISGLEPLLFVRRKGALEEKVSSNLSGHLHEKRLSFREELDVRGMRAVDAIQAVDFFVDEALQVGSERVKVLHGTGTGALRQSVREWLATSPHVKRFQDEDVRFGGAGITVVYL